VFWPIVIPHTIKDTSVSWRSLLAHLLRLVALWSLGMMTWQVPLELSISWGTYSHNGILLHMFICYLLGVATYLEDLHLGMVIAHAYGWGILAHLCIPYWRGCLHYLTIYLVIHHYVYIGFMNSLPLGDLIWIGSWKMFVNVVNEHVFCFISFTLIFSHNGKVKKRVVIVVLPRETH
jgi:hypothetical protein